MGLAAGTKVVMVNDCPHGHFKAGEILTIQKLTYQGSAYFCEEKFSQNMQKQINIPEDKFILYETVEVLKEIGD